MTKPAKDDIALLRLVGEAIRQALIKPPCCMQGTGCELPPCGCSQEAGKAALDAIRAAGWAVVPVEPTEEMFDAGHASSAHGHGIVALYRAMLAAAPGVKP
jgi:hypothetical protein